MRLFPVARLLGAAVLYGCTTTGAVASGAAPVTGRWGGARADLTLTEAGGSIRYDCAHGALNAPVVPDGAGGFDVAGVHLRERGGPVRIGQVPDSLPARYVGRVSGHRMTLRSFIGTDTLGPFELELGAAPQLVRCL